LLSRGQVKGYSGVSIWAAVAGLLRKKFVAESKWPEGGEFSAGWLVL